MPTARSTGSRAGSMRTSFLGYLKDFATTVTLITQVETKDSMNRIISNVPVESTILADVQWLSKSDLAHINVGDVQVGDGLLFVEYDVTINLEDEFVINGVQWRIVEQVEGEQVAGEIVYQGYVIRKNVQT